MKAAVKNSKSPKKKTLLSTRQTHASIALHLTMAQIQVKEVAKSEALSVRAPGADDRRYGKVCIENPWLVRLTGFKVHCSAEKESQRRFFGLTSAEEDDAVQGGERFDGWDERDVTDVACLEQETNTKFCACAFVVFVSMIK